GAPLQHVATAGTDGSVEVVLRLTQATRLPAASLGCLDETRLDAAVADLEARGPAELGAGGHSVDATFAPSPRERTAVLGIVRTPGWLCSGGEGERRPPDALAGLVSVPLPAGEAEVSCTFRPRGLTMGLALGSASLLGVGGLVVAV